MDKILIVDDKEDIRSCPVGFMRSQTDNIERGYAYQAVPGHPLFVVVGISKQYVLARTAAARNTILRVSTLISLLLIGTAALLIRHESTSPASTCAR